MKLFILQIFLIKFCKIITNKIYNFDEFSKYPVMIKSLEDIDFCLKYFFFRIYGGFNDEIYKMRCKGSLDEIDKRIPIFYIYSSFKIESGNALKYISEEQFKTMNFTLIIKDFIIIGDKQFHNTIKTIEKDFIHTNIEYFSMNQVRNHLNNKISKYIKYRNFSYIIIIRAKEAENNFNELFSLKNDFALKIILIIYIDDLNTLINKNILMETMNIPVFFAYNVIEIKNFIISQKNCNCGRNFRDLPSELKNYLIENTSLNKFFQKNHIEKENDNTSIEDGWELVDLVPKEFFNTKYLSIMGIQNIDAISLNLFNIYKKNKNESLFFQRYCAYFNFNILPFFFCQNTLDVILKQICYAYSLDESNDNDKNSFKNSFYYIMNKDLRSGDPSIYEKYLNLISAFNISLEEKILKSYSGEVYRATVLDKDFIENKIIVGKSLTNVCFWSSSKCRNIAENFLAGPNKNILFWIKSKGNNIDIDSEKLYFFDEKEVLFIPFSKFLITSKEKKMYKNKEIYEVKLEELDTIDKREKIKSYDITMEESYAFMGNLKTIDQ